MPALMRNRMPSCGYCAAPQAWEAVVRPGRLEGRNLVSDEVLGPVELQPETRAKPAIAKSMDLAI